MADFPAFYICRCGILVRTNQLCEGCRRMMRASAHPLAPRRRRGDSTGMIIAVLLAIGALYVAASALHQGGDVTVEAD